MIFFTLGTNEARFDRMLHAVDALDLDEPLIVQTGSSPVRPARATCFEQLPFEVLTSYVRAARLVVTHAGVGSILVALMNGKHPLVVPRLARFGEAVDDHQLTFGRRFADAGFVTLVEDPADLRPALAAARGGDAAVTLSPDHTLTAELRWYLAARVAQPPAAATC